MQQLKTEITIPIPSNMVLVTKTEYDELQQAQQIGKTWKLADLKRELNIPKSTTWIKELVLKPNYDDIADWCYIVNGGSGRSSTIMLASKAKAWFDENWSNIDWDEKL